MSDPTTGGGPSEEELRAYLESLRAAHPVEVVVQSFGILATASEVKLGRPDARVLIDGMAALLEATAERLPSEIVTKMRETVTQLQMAQVQAERDVASQQGQPGQGESAADNQSGQPAQPSQPAEESPASRLWIPGRD